MSYAKCKKRSREMTLVKRSEKGYLENRRIDTNGKCVNNMRT